MAIRTFIALDLDEAILDALGEVRAKLDDPSAKIRWTGRSNIHVTMQFLGDVEEGMTSEVCERAGRTARQVQPFDFEIRGVVCVPSAGQIRMVWANVLDPTGEMLKLHDALASELKALGFEPEKRRFKPHLTLARIKYISDVQGFRDAAAVYKDAHFGTQQGAELVTYSSQLRPEGPVYHALHRAPLGG
jgi:2'-5' RNA ligase